MGTKYNKYYSNYILRKKHQNVNNGEVFERDWVTIGAWQRFEKGKTPIYYDGNFLFTTSSIKNSNKKPNYVISEESYTYEDIPNKTIDTVNPIIDKCNKLDFKDYVYYGSSVDMLRTSIENIIKWFPCNLRTSNVKYKETEEYIINNPFKIDLHHEGIVLEDNMNPLRYFSISYLNYKINGTLVNKFNITKLDYDICENQGQKVYTININDHIIYGYLYDDDILYTTNEKNLEIVPEDFIIEDFFNNLNTFESKLLNRNTSPLYTCELTFPYEGENSIRYTTKNFTWPSNGYCINIDCPSYYKYLSELTDIAKIYDEIWTDNLYSKMTHESIKNYDWTFSREYTTGDEQDNIDGGVRIEKLLHLYGRCFDNIKRKIDTIKNTQKSTYNNYLNMSYDEVKTRIPYTGFDILSFSSYLDNNTKVDKTKWYKTLNSENFGIKEIEEEFFRRLLLSSKYILSAKGTKHSIEMIMGLFGINSDDYKIEEQARYTTPLDINKKQEIEFANKSKYIPRYDDSPFSGLPISIIHFNNVNVIVPYTSHDKFYDGDIYFQSKGGWCKIDNNYLETVPYLNVVYNIEDLNNISIHNLNNNDIYFVVNNDIHYYMYNSTDNIWEEIDEEDERVKQISRIVYSTFGNNPHSGFGNYDEGKEYFDYLSQPFKYAVDNKLIDDPNIVFNITTEIMNDKIIDSTEFYYLNDKKIYFSIKNLDNKLFNNFFNEVILPYMLQVIPSTAILIIKEYKDE